MAAATAADMDGGENVAMGQARPYVYRWGRSNIGTAAAAGGVEQGAAADAGDGVGGLIIMLRHRKVCYAGVLAPAADGAGEIEH